MRPATPIRASSMLQLIIAAWGATINRGRLHGAFLTWRLAPRGGFETVLGSPHVAACPARTCRQALENVELRR